MFWEIAGAHGICPEVHYPVPEFATLAGGDWVQRIPRALAALGVGLYNPSSAPGRLMSNYSPRQQNRHAAHRQAATPRHVPPDGATRNAVAWAPRATPPLPRQRRSVADGGAGVPRQCADEHLHYCRHEQGPTTTPGWRDALAHLFHTTGTRDPRLRLVHPTRAKQDAHTGPRVTPDGLHLHVGGYRRRNGLSPPTRGAAYHPPAALMYILRDVLAESEHQEPNADVAWPEPLRPRPHAPMPLCW